MGEIECRAVLDYIGFPPRVPGNLECRLQKGMFRDGVWIDDGSRDGARQTEKHRFVIEVEQDIDARLAEVGAHLAAMGYAPPDMALARMVARRVRRSDFIAHKRSLLGRQAARTIIRGLGFDLYHSGEIAVGLAKATHRANGDVAITHKAQAIVYPGDPLPEVIGTINLFAERAGYEPIDAADTKMLVGFTGEIWRQLPDARTEHRAFALDWRPVPVEPLMRLQ